MRASAVSSTQGIRAGRAFVELFADDSKLVRGLRRALQDPKLPPGLLRRHARAVYDRLIAPIAPHLEGVEMLLLAPEGPLNLIPFGALVDASDRFLIERFTVAAEGFSTPVQRRIRSSLSMPASSAMPLSVTSAKTAWGPPGARSASGRSLQ